MERHDVIVVGAGLAGLGAALELEAAGLDVCVLEAQPRVGGRIHSMRQLGRNAEAGGTYIGAGYRRVIETANRFGIGLIDVTPVLEFFREQDLVLGTEIISQADWPEHPSNPYPDADRTLMPWNYHRVLTMRENPLESPADWLAPEHADLDVSMHEWMRKLGLGERVIELGYGINTSFGADADDVSAALLLFRAAFSKEQRLSAPGSSLGFTAARGVDTIPAAMAAALSRDVRLDAVVTGIADDGRETTVHCADGTRLGAARVVCSVPFGVLRAIPIDPPLAGAQADAVRSLPAQPITQVYLRPRSRFWELDGHAPSLFTDSLPGMLAAVRSGDDPSEITHLTAWAMGRHAEALDTLDKADAGRRVIDAIERIRPAAAGQLELIDLKSWGADPYAAGAWAYFRPGQVQHFARLMGRPHGRIHFCGEHLASSSRGMEAAMETGERAAREIIESI